MLLCLHCACEVGSSLLIDTEEDEDAFLCLSCVRHNSKDLGNEGNELEYVSTKGERGKDVLHKQSDLEAFCS